MRSTVTGLTIRKLLGVLELGAQGDLVLLQSTNSILSLLNLAGQILRLHKKLLLGGVGVIQSTGQLVLLLVGLDNQALGHLAVLLHVGAVTHGLLKSSPGFLEIPLHASLVLLRLGLVLVDSIDLVAQLSHAVVMLLAKSSQCTLMSNVSLIEVRLQLDQLSLTLLVQLNLSAGVGANLSQPGAKVLKVPGQQGAILLSLGSVVALHGQLFVKLVNTGLELLDLLGVLGPKGLLVLNLSSNGGDLLVLALNSLAKLRVDTLKVGNSLLSQLEVTLNLPLLLLDIALSLLFTLKSVLTLIKGLLELALHLVEVVAPVLCGLDILLCLLPTLASGLLFLAQLDNHVFLVGNFIPEGADLGVLGVLVILALLNGRLEVLDLLPQSCSISSDLGSSLLDLVDLVVLTLDTGVGRINLLLQVVLGSLQPIGLVNDVLNGGSTRCQGKNKLVLLSGELGVDLNHGAAVSHGLVDVSLSDGNLLLVLLLVLSKLGALEVGLDRKPKLKPEPGLGHHVGTDGSLAGIEGHLLVLQLLELHPGGLTTGTSLQPGKDGANLVLPLLLHPAANAGPEEDQGVAQPELLLVQLDDVHHGLSGGLVVLGLGHSRGSNDVVPGLELGIGKLVGESSTADSNTGEHTVALVLVHNQAWFHTSGLLVGVGHHTTDEVGLGLVEGGHQVVELALEVGGDSLTALTLLPVLVLGSLQGLAGVILEALNGQRIAAVLDQFNNGVASAVMVLLQPSCQVVGDGGGVVDDGKVRVGVRAGVGLGELSPLAQKVGHELLGEGGIGCFWEEGLLLKDGKEGHGLLKHVNALLQIHAKVNVGPVQTLADVHFLLKGEHVGVEELLQLLVDVVDADLLEAVVVKDLKAGDVKDTDVGDLLHGWVAQGLVTLVHCNPEGTLVDGTGNAGNGVGGGGTGGTLLHPLGSDLQLGLAEVGDHPLTVNAEELGNFLAIGGILDLSLLFLADGNKVLGHVAHVHHAGSVLEHIVLHLCGEAKNVKGLISKLHVLLVVNGGHGQLALGHIPVVLDVIGQQALLLQVRNLVRHEVVEGVVATLQRLLVGETGLLEQVNDHVGSRQLSRGVEVDPDELSKPGGVVVPHSFCITPRLKDG